MTFSMTTLQLTALRIRMLDACYYCRYADAHIYWEEQYSALFWVSLHWLALMLRVVNTSLKETIVVLNACRLSVFGERHCAGCYAERRYSVACNIKVLQSQFTIILTVQS